MAVRIRLKKFGRRHRPFFRVCAMDGRAPRDGRVIEELGIYDPLVPETDARAILKGERIAYWLGVGAQPTRKVDVLIKKYGASGTHLAQQEAALGRLSGRRAAAIETAKAAAAAVEMPKVEEPKPAEAPPADEAAADSEASKTDAADATPADEAATEAPAAEASAGETPAKEAPAEKAAE
jgi:small subunit ribosomal protein S16